MKFVKVEKESLFVYHSFTELRKEYSHISFPPTPNIEFLKTLNIYPLVYPENKPDITYKQKLVESIPINKEGQFIEWGIEWIVVEASEQEQLDALNHIKMEIGFYLNDLLDRYAANKGYDGILSLCSYSDSQYEPFRLEAQEGIRVRDVTWKKAIEFIETLQKEERVFNGVSDIDPLIPDLVK